MSVTTNNVPRHTLDAYELDATERKQFDYIDWPAVERGEASATFVRYRGELIDLGDFEVVGHTLQMAQRLGLAAWHGWRPDSFYSAVVIRYAEDNESVVVGLYIVDDHTSEA